MRKNGQSILEYVVLFSVMVSAFVLMFGYVKRAVNAHLKLVEEQVNQEGWTIDPE